MSVARAIILAAGQGFSLDGVNKVLIRHPRSGRTVLEHALEAFAGKQVTVVVGFRAIEIMQYQPQLDYVINHDWAVTHNARSLGLALDERPCYVVSGDIFFEPALVRDLDAAPANLVLTDEAENRGPTAIHCVLSGGRRVSEMYPGLVRDPAHPQAVGLFKVSSAALLAEWKRRCMRHGNLFVGQLLPCDLDAVTAVSRRAHAFDEINTADDYLRLARR